MALSKVHAQGPPITSDKPIMLGGGSSIIKTLTEIRSTDQGTFVRAPLMVHYLPTSNTLVALHLPFVHYNFNDDFGGGQGSTFGDMDILAKYQFYRKDGTGKTFRMVAKTLQTLPTGKKLEIDDFSIGEYSGYYSIVAGYESLKYGLSFESGFEHEPTTDFDKVVVKAGLGLPLLKPTYPVNQLNLYFEPQVEIFTEFEASRLLYAQGIQYAKGVWTWEASYQFPITQSDAIPVQRDYSIFLGTRFIF